MTDKPILSEGEIEQIENFEFVYRNGGTCVNKTLVQLCEEIIKENVVKALDGLNNELWKSVKADEGNMLFHYNEVNTAIEKTKGEYK